MAESGAEKSQKPTEKRRKEALKEGDVPQSKELVLALTAMAAIGWLALAGGLLVAQMQQLLIDGLTLDGSAITRFEPARGLGAPLVEIGITLGLLCLGLILAALASAFAVGGFGYIELHRLEYVPGDLAYHLAIVDYQTGFHAPSPQFWSILDGNGVLLSTR